MLCLQCGQLSVPETRYGGSDAAEVLLFSLWSLPGWLYCYWRHLGREKVCERCGSQELMRESRASRLRAPASLRHGPERVAPLYSPAHRLVEFRRHPRHRLRVGALATLLGTAIAGAASLGVFGTIGMGRGYIVAQLASLTALCWIPLHEVLGRGYQATLTGCRAWDAQGRSLRIEAI